MKPAAIPLLVASAMLAACDLSDQDTVDYLMQDGAWGWDNGAGCEGLADAWVIDGKWADIYRDGAPVDRMLIQARQIERDDSVEGVSGGIDAMKWYFVARDPDDPAQLVQHQVRFSVSGNAFSDPGLIAWKRRTLLHPQTKEKRDVQDPRGGERLAPCPADMPVPAVRQNDG